MKSIHSICVYCGSSAGSSARYVEAGAALGGAIGAAGLRLVYGGGAKGVMGAVASGAMGAGGKVTGIIPRFLMNKEATEDALAQLDELVTTEDMHQRKHIMFEKSDAFVALPGGIGTLEEIVEIMTWAQLGRHSKPIVFANLDGFWDPMLALLDHMRAEGFVHTGDRVRPLVIDRVDDIVPTLVAETSAGQDARGDRQVINRL
ncbi:MULTISPECIES: TIGR00730 family Rossman fold protein [Nitratireductor]|uniref:LOG family protein n=1 Tax=Nitratireductor TaxID=245876 RepID=UPI000D0D06D9|nr:MULTISPECIES: TIGR00730 family Rossman fold protein [Nitratireductor]PSM17139.1 TIGR00730 family Rossman fold protein [Nitratireductor sp. StC3]